MQFTNSDGSIVLSVQIDESGLKKGMNSMKNGVSSIFKQFKSLAGTIAAAFSIKAVWDFSKAAGEASTQTEASVQRLIDIYGKASESVGDFIDFNARAVGLAAEAALNWDSVVVALKRTLGVIELLLSASLLVIGVILLFTGAGIPLGLGLVFAGAEMLGHAAKSFDWDWLPKGVKGVINSIIGIVEKGVNFLIDKVNVFIQAVGRAVSAVGDLIGVELNSLVMFKTH